MAEEEEREPEAEERGRGGQAELSGHATHSTAGGATLVYGFAMDRDRAGIALEAVTFDVTHTLLECPALGEQYASVLARHGLEVDARDIETAIPLVWQELACSAEPARDRFASHRSHGGGARGFWRHFVERTCELVGAGRPSPFAAAELFDRFSRADAWRIADGAPEVLAELKRRGLKLAVIANWDERLPTLLERLDLGRFFDATIVSSLVGVEKPHPRIFETALTALDVEAGRALHVGDSRLDDFEGASAAGMHALLLARGGGGDLVDLRELPARLDGMARGEAVTG